MTCDRFLEDVMSGRVSHVTNEHLRMCPECRSQADSVVSLGRRLRDPVLWEEPPADLRSQVVTAVSGDLRPENRPLHRWWAAAAGAAAGLALVSLAWLASRPDWEMDLVAGAAAPNAGGSVAGFVEDGATRMVFTISGFDPAPSGTYYEVWLTAADGRHVSAGTFRSPGRVEVMAGVQRSEFPRIWITLEPADGDTAPAPSTILDTPSP